MIFIQKSIKSFMLPVRTEKNIFPESVDSRKD